MRMSKGHQHKCQHVYKRHNSVKMLCLSKHVSAFTFALLNADVRCHGWGTVIISVKLNL